MSEFIYTLTITAALGSAIIGGIMYAFSTFVMRSFAQLVPAQGIEAMQVINRTIINPWFLSVFMGTALISLGLGGNAIWHFQQEDTIYVLAGSLLYLIGVFLVTMIFNVPMNDALEAESASSMEAAELWNSYLSRWTFWNHVRTAAAILGALAFILAA